MVRERATLGGASGRGGLPVAQDCRPDTWPVSGLG
jgi:hypothetical protein